MVIASFVAPVREEITQFSDHVRMGLVSQLKTFYDFPKNYLGIFQCSDHDQLHAHLATSTSFLLSSVEIFPDNLISDFNDSKFLIKATGSSL